MTEPSNLFAAVAAATLLQRSGAHRQRELGLTDDVRPNVCLGAQLDDAKPLVVLRDVHAHHLHGAPRTV